MLCQNQLRSKITKNAIMANEMQKNFTQNQFSSTIDMVNCLLLVQNSALICDFREFLYVLLQVHLQCGYAVK